MNYLIRKLLILALVTLLVNCQTNTNRTKQSDNTSNSVLAMMSSSTDDTGFKKAIEPIPFQFPRDFGPHPDFRTEWWYFTGNVSDSTGRLYGFQLTFFRTAMSPDSVIGDSEWRTSHVYMGHFAITDVVNNTFYQAERFSRGALGLAGAQSEPFRVWLDDWMIETASDQSGSEIAVHVYAADDSHKLDLRIVNEKPLVLQGNNGLSRKGPEPGNTSYYYSYTRLTVSGRITLDGEQHAVTGHAWFDREWSTSALRPDQAGWDWFSLQLDNGYDLMWYQIRNKDGSLSPFSGGSLVDDDGHRIEIKPNQVTLNILSTWKSPTGITYPSEWEIIIPSEKLQLHIAPQVKAQEWTGQFRYWEGVVTFDGIFQNKKTNGYGYVELTGY
ncbi:carotenoid 1,2-hydratase [candidate division KSB1 bacterium]|nr:carotenoid 1,2-hydratase [candidate division KSB1 bacterium]